MKLTDRRIFLSVFAILCYTTAMCYDPPEQYGYSKSDVAAMNRLIQRETSKPKKPTNLHREWSAERKLAAFRELGWENLGK